MSTTSLKLPDDVQELAAAAAERLGVTPHAFMVEAIRGAALNSERRARSVAEAVAARDVEVENGLGYAAEEVHAYARALVTGRSVRKPKAKSWRV